MGSADGGFPAMGGGGYAAQPNMPITQQATRHARRIYVGGLPPGSNEGIVATFFSNALAAIGGTQPMPGDPVLNVYMNQEKKFGFVEFRTVEETSNAMALDGVLMEGVTLRVRRPNDYNPAVAATLGPSGPSPILNITAIGLEPGKAGSGGGGGGGSAEDQGNRLFVGGLPYFLTEAMVRELVEAFGPVKSFQLVVDRETGNSKGYGFFVYVDQSVTDVACQGLHGMKMGDKVLTVRRATTQGSVKPGGASTAIVPPPIYGGVLPAMGQEGWMPGMGPMSGVAGMPGTYAMPDQSAMFAQVQAHLAGAGGAGAPGAAGVDGVAAGAPGVLPPAANPESTVLSLTDMLDVEELRDDTEYAEITEDMKEECGKYGAVLSMVIPRPPAPGSVEHVPGLGKVFVQFADVVGATAARSALHGRKFGGQIVKADYLAEGAFVAQAFS